MGHDYGVDPKFLAISITRDNVAAPGNRLVDKHSRLFFGKTLDEWCAIQVWSSKRAARHVFVAETEAHKEKLLYLHDRYGCDIFVRPKGMLAQMADTGGVPLVWATNKALAEEWHPLVTQPFVVSPCRPPGFFDRMTEEYLKAFPNPDTSRTQMWIMGGCETDFAYFIKDGNGVGNQPKDIELYLNRNTAARVATTQHWMGFSHWWVHYQGIAAGRHDLTISPTLYDIPPWQDIHIDTADNWEWAEYWFGKKIGGIEAYEQYRETWAG
jgi:hypothetical protein